jgi:3-methyladenine DNA glycosylase Tag
VAGFGATGLCFAGPFGAESQPAMEPFARIEAVAAKRKGGAAALERLLPKPRTRAALAGTPDAFFLSALAKQIFRAGFVWQIVEYKWPTMEEAFGGFDPEVVAGLGDHEVEELLADPRAIRNRAKIESVRSNAAWMVRMAGSHGSFGSFLGAWPTETVVDLWEELRKQGSRLGGMTGPFFLREVGKDTFLLTADVVKGLRRARVVKGDPTSKRDLAAVQQAFNAWREQSGRPLCQLSRILAFSVV